jgi:TatD DNase family protein
MASLVDTHAHLDFDKFDPDREAVIARALEGGLEAIVTVGTHPASWEAAWEIARHHERIFPALGYHPNYLNEVEESAWPSLVQWLEAHRPVAIGEIGLDYHWDTVSHEKQHDFFRKQLKLAQEMDLPVVIHCRDAYEDCLRVLREACPSGARGVMHCFSGNKEVAGAAVGLGIHISFGGPLTYKKSDAIQETARWTPLERILVETDCPFLSPQPRRGERNEPAFVRFTVEKLAEIRGMSFEEVAEATTANARNLFQL